MTKEVGFSDDDTTEAVPFQNWDTVTLKLLVVQSWGSVAGLHHLSSQSSRQVGTR